VWHRGWLCALLALAAIIVVTPPAMAASPYRIGAITEAWSANHPAVDGLKEGLRELGFAEGRDVTYDVHFTSGKPEAAVAAAEALVKARVDLIFTSGEAATLAAKKVARSIPVVFTLVGDPVSIGVVQTLAHPGGNLTGVSSRTVELAAKRLEVLTMLAPGTRRVWYFYYAGDITDTAAVGDLHGAASKLGVEVLARAVNDAGQLTQAMREIKPADALFAPSSSTLDIPVAIHEAALAGRIPGIFPSALWVGHGAVASYGSDFRAEGIQAARLVAKILRGAKPKDIPVEGAEHVHLALNLKTAATLASPLPRKLIFRANVVHR
jgi:putative ABC transport system substrate-binding protein